jgi:gliding motility-associated-like protein
MRVLRLAILCLLLTTLARAAQVGGEIVYADLGAGNYQVTLKLYRDCFSSPAPFDNPAKISVYDANGQFVDSLMIAFTSSAPVPPTISNPCFTPPPGICVDVATYSANISLPPKTGGYYLVYQRCCRSASILNIANPGSTGSTYVEHIPGPEVAATNSSPYFTAPPPTFFCDGVGISYYFSASDPDGDSLVYEFCPPLKGLNPCCQLLAPVPPTTGAPGCVNPPPGLCPERGQAPPYSFVSYVTPYSGFFPVSSNPAMQINPQTGQISGVPNITGQWAVAICVKEYRNGVLIGRHVCDFQFNIVNCPNLIQSSILPQQQLCTGLTLNFTNLSSGGTSYTWDFGDPGTTSDVSNQQNPSYTYPDTGKYVVTLINHGPNPACNDTTTEIFYVYQALNPSFVPPAPQCIVGNSYNFTAGGQFAPYATFYWNLSSWATPATSTQQNPTGVTYNQYGNFPVTLVVKQKSCTKTFTDTVKVYPNTVTQFQQDSFSGCQPLAVSFTNTSVFGGATAFTWYFGNGDSLNAVNASYVYQDTGTFNITLVSTTSVGCVGTSTVTGNGLVTVFPGPKAGFTADPTFTNIYNPNISFTDTSKNVTLQVVNMGDGSTFTSIPPGYSYTGYGTFVVTQIALSSNGCSDTARQTIIIDPDFTFYVPNSFSPNRDVHNERFRVVAFGIYDYSISIFDRWGHEVFSSSDPEESWDGTWRGKKCEEDVYVYKAEFTPVTDPYPRRITGVIHLIR